MVALITDACQNLTPGPLVGQATQELLGWAAEEGITPPDPERPDPEPESGRHLAEEIRRLEDELAAGAEKAGSSTTSQRPVRRAPVRGPVLRRGRQAPLPHGDVAPPIARMSRRRPPG